MFNRHSKGFIIALALLSFLPFLSLSPLFDWDEVNFAEAAREMMVTSDYWHVTIGYVPFYEKPPLFFWMQVICMKLFGINEFAARLPNATAGLITLVLLYKHSFRFYAGSKKAILWPMVYLCSWLPSFYFRSGIIDPVFNLFIYLAVVQLYHYYNPLGENHSKALTIIFSAVYAGLAVLTKGPVGIGIPLLVWGVFYILNWKKLVFPLWHGILFLIVSVLIGASWFLTEYMVNGPDFFFAWFDYQRRLFFESEAGHGQPWYYHPLVLLLGCFPASWLMLGVIRNTKRSSDAQRIFTQFMWVMFWIVLIIFSVVKTKIVHYSSLCYFPITWLASEFLCSVYNRRSLKSLTFKLSLSFGIILGLVLLALPILFMHTTAWLSLIQDPFAVANIKVDAGWSFADCVPGLILVTGMLVSLGWMKSKVKESLAVFLFSNWLCMITALPMFVPKIQQMTQGAMIDFYKSMRGKDVYVHALGFRSYAQFYYSGQQPEFSASAKGMTEAEFNSWLREGRIDYDVYMVSKDSEIKNHLSVDMDFLYEKGGYIFIKRSSRP